MQIVSGLENVRALKTHRVVLCPNHSSTMDLDVAFLFARLLKEQPYFLCTREIFRGRFLKCWMLQLFGCFSVIRGRFDSNSLKKSVELLEEGKHKLVIFPEGEISNRNDYLLPLKPGPAHVAVTTKIRMLAKQENQPIYLVPVALRYTYPKVSLKQLMIELHSLEERMGLIPRVDETLEQRATNMINVILDELIAKHTGVQDKQTRTESRAIARRRILLKLAAYVNYKPPENINEVELAHRVYLHLYEARWLEQCLEKSLNYAKHHDRYQLLNQFIHDCHRLVNFIAIDEVTTRHNMDDFIGTLLTIKREVSPEKRWRLPVHVLVSFGTPILVEENATETHPKKAELVQDLNSKLSRELEKQLKSLIK